MGERMRLETLCARDGVDAARQWASWAAALYRRSILDSTHFASQPDLKTRFEESIREFDTFAKSGVIHDVEYG
jgi:hypothetical protein